MPRSRRVLRFRPTSPARVQFDKDLSSASPESYCRGASIPGHASATRPELGMVSPELRIRYGVPGTQRLYVNGRSQSRRSPLISPVDRPPHPCNQKKSLNRADKSRVRFGESPAHEKPRHRAGVEDRAARDSRFQLAMPRVLIAHPRTLPGCRDEETWARWKAPGLDTHEKLPQKLQGARKRSVEPSFARMVVSIPELH